MSRRLAAVPDTPRRATALVRVSKVGGREDLASPEIQRVSIEDYARGHGIEVVEWVEALDESASASRSPWWRRLDAAVGQVEAGERDVVLVWKVSRAARHRRNWAVALDRIEVAGGTLESSTEGLDTTTSTGRLARGMLAELAAWESEVKGEQWKEAHARRRRNGLPHAGGQRLGYSYAKGQGYTVDPEGAALVVELYRRYLAGEGYRPLALWLRSRGVLSPRSGTTWTARGVAYLLDSGFPAGVFRAGGLYVQGAHEPIIDAATWRAYQRERARRGDVPPRQRDATTVLAGWVRCAGCRYSMRSKTDKRYGPGYLYACEQQGCPAPVTVTRSRVEETVKDWLRPYASDVDAAAQVKTASKVERALARADRRRLQQQIERLTAQLTRLTIDLSAQVIGQEEFAAARTELLAQRAALELERSKLEEVELRPMPSPAVVAQLLADWDTVSVAGRRGILRSLLQAALVTKGKRARPTAVAYGLWEQLPVQGS